MGASGWLIASCFMFLIPPMVLYVRGYFRRYWVEIFMFLSLVAVSAVHTNCVADPEHECVHWQQEAMTALDTLSTYMGLTAMAVPLVDCAWRLQGNDNVRELYSIVVWTITIIIVLFTGDGLVAQILLPMMHGIALLASVWTERLFAKQHGLDKFKENTTCLRGTMLVGATTLSLIGLGLLLSALHAVPGDDPGLKEALLGAKNAVLAVACALAFWWMPTEQKMAEYMLQILPKLLQGTELGSA